MCTRTYEDSCVLLGVRGVRPAVCTHVPVARVRMLLAVYEYLVRYDQLFVPCIYIHSSKVNYSITAQQ